MTTRERELYDPERQKWYRGVAERVNTYFDRERQQWVTVALDQQEVAEHQCDGYAGDPGASAPRCERYRGHPGPHRIFLPGVSST